MIVADLSTLEPGTAQPGSEPGPGGKTSDSPTDDNKGQNAPGSPTGEEDKDENGKPLPFDSHPKWKSARQAEKTLQKLLGDNDLESVEDLIELVESGRKVIGKVDLDSLDEIITKANTLTQYERTWDAQREAERAANEDPEETAERLTRENAQLRAERARQTSIEANQKALKEFNTIVSTGVKEALPEVPEYQRKFVETILGVDNPALDVDITNKAAVAKVVRGIAKQFEGFKQKIIKDYLEGKERIPDVGRSGESALPATGEVKTMKDAHKAFASFFKR